MIMSAGCQIRVGRKQKKEERVKEKGRCDTYIFHAGGATLPLPL